MSLRPWRNARTRSASGDVEFRNPITGIVCCARAASGHAAAPHAAIDTNLTAAHIVVALPSIASRNVDPLESAVISTTVIHAGEAENVIPQDATLKGTVRTFSEKIRDLVEARMNAIADATAAMHGAKIKFTYHRGYPVTVNHADQTAFAARIAADVAGDARVNTAVAPIMGAEDFSYMLEARPGAYLFLGIGPGAGLHHAAYDFNDEAAPIGASFFARLVERAQPLA